MWLGTNRHYVDSRVLRIILGPLEVRVMEILWDCGNCCVRDVVGRLNKRTAYTTVMTTLDRLYKKKLLGRKMCDRAYFYQTRVSRREWQESLARQVVAKLVAGSEASRDVLVACLLEAIRQQDALLVRELQNVIRNRDSRTSAGASGMNDPQFNHRASPAPEYYENFIPGIA